jgi:hypothetical protein
MARLRLAFLLRPAEFSLVGFGVALYVLIVVSATHLVPIRIGVMVLLAAIVSGLSPALRAAYWLRAGGDGLTLVRLLIPRSYPWSAVQGLAMEFDEDEETGRHQVGLRIRLSAPKGRRPGPLLGRLRTTRDDLPKGTEPAVLADLFALFGDRGLPVDRPEFANAVLAAHGRPALRTQPSTYVPTGPVPTPEQAYADAPDIADERRRLAEIRFGVVLPGDRRQFLLRDAALRDRAALQAGDTDSSEATGALVSARKLAEHDEVLAGGNPRGYVRQQYLIWRTEQTS